MLSNCSHHFPFCCLCAALSSTQSWLQRRWAAGKFLSAQDAFHPIDPDRWIAGGEGCVFSTDDNGQTWSCQNYWDDESRSAYWFFSALLGTKWWYEPPESLHRVAKRRIYRFLWGRYLWLCRYRNSTHERPLVPPSVTWRRRWWAPIVLWWAPIVRLDYLPTWRGQAVFPQNVHLFVF